MTSSFFNDITKHHVLHSQSQKHVTYRTPLLTLTTQHGRHQLTVTSVEFPSQRHRLDTRLRKQAHEASVNTLCERVRNYRSAVRISIKQYWLCITCTTLLCDVVKNVAIQAVREVIGCYVVMSVAKKVVKVPAFCLNRSHVLTTAEINLKTNDN